MKGKAYNVVIRQVLRDNENFHLLFRKRRP